jgi:ISXO2-like transposase domain/Helix-turn-helix domain
MSIASTGLGKARHPLAYRVGDAVALSGLCRSTIYNLMRAGKLAYVDVGGVRLIHDSELRTDAVTVQAEIHRYAELGSTLHTDEAGVYSGIGDMFFDHDTVNHSEGEFARDGVTTNSVESVFAVLKRGLIGVYHHASQKHLGRYVNEFTFRLMRGT